jgi:hypothetical protein
MPNSSAGRVDATMLLRHWATPGRTSAEHSAASTLDDYTRTMRFPAPTFLGAHGVLQLADIRQRERAVDDAFIAAVASEFPNSIMRSEPASLPPPAATPHLVLASSSSQLALSASQADFDVRFYGEFLTDVEQGLQYVERKLRTVLEGFDAIGAQVTSVGVVAPLHFSYPLTRPDEPKLHMLRKHLRTRIEPEEVADAFARVAVKVRGKYFVNLTMNTYESRTFERPFMAMAIPQALRLRPWDGKLDDIGLELLIDINNNLEGRIDRKDPVVTDDGLRAVIGLLTEVATSSGPAYAKTGHISAAALTSSSEL